MRPEDYTDNTHIDNAHINAVLGANTAFLDAAGRKRLARVVTFGCKMNENDSEKIMGLLALMGFGIEWPQASGKFGNPAPLGALGFLREDDPAPGAPLADLVILNTCCVRDNAEKRLYGILGSLKKYKSDDPARVLAVCGCMAQTEKCVSEIKNKYPYVDFIFGTKSISALPMLLAKSYNGERGRGKDMPVANGLAPDAAPEDRLPMYRKAPPSALVSVMSGCDNFCSYCVVPYVRGGEQSRTPESVEGEVRRLAAEGYREITLLGQNVNSYGRGLAGGRCDFAGLLERLGGIGGIWRIRFMTSHPKDLSDRLIYAIRDIEAVCPQLHLPAQSGSTAVLERMNRGYSREHYLELVEKIKGAVPGITLTTDIIAGFPGEGEADFEDTLSLVEKAQFDMAYTFIFSPREGTKAADLPGRVAGETIKSRFDRLLALQNSISLKKNQAAVGSIERLLCEGASKTNPGRYAGRTPGGKIVNFRGGKIVNFRAGSGSAIENDGTAGAADLTGKIVAVRIDEARTWSLGGEAISID